MPLPVGPGGLEQCRQDACESDQTDLHSGSPFRVVDLMAAPLVVPRSAPLLLLLLLLLLPANYRAANDRATPDLMPGNKSQKPSREGVKAPSPGVPGCPFRGA